jgi:hypothetical protein
MFEELTVKLLPPVIRTESVPMVPRVPSLVIRIFDVDKMEVSATSIVPPTSVVVPVLIGR